MNREKKFKVWLKYKKEMANVTTIDFKKGCVFIDKPYFPKIPEFYGTALTFDQIELIEYTGLKDKNGVEIFEGDIVRCDDEICTIVWDELYITYAVSDKENNNDSLGNFESKDLEVIGNIYENGGLLNESIRFH